MSKPYDATSKELIENDPAGWVAFLGCSVPPSAVRLVDADLSTVTTDTDKVIRVDEPERWLLHLDIQTGSDWEIERRLLQYNVLLHHRHGLPIASVVVLLRKSGNMTWLNGSLPIAPPLGPAWEFRYQVIRVWERSASEFLTGPLGLLPLAPLADVHEADLPATINEMRMRIDGQSDRALSAKLWTATYLLMGLRFDAALIDNVLSGGDANGRIRHVSGDPTSRCRAGSARGPQRRPGGGSDLAPPRPRWRQVRRTNSRAR